jgi:pimeloyl-ACP methyl ester carboxylesterase
MFFYFLREGSHMKSTNNDIAATDNATGNRRRLLKAMAGTPLLAGILGQSAAAKPSAGGAKTFVLVHGAWHGAWCWRDVRTMLEKQGHRVFTPTFTGMGERHHLSSATVDLGTHIRDVAAVIECEELNNIVLVGHSYGGYIVQGVTDLMPAKIQSIIYLDAMLPVAGKAARDTWPPELVAQTEKTLIDGFKLASFPPEMFDIPPTDKTNTEWMKRRLTDMPYGVFKTPFPATPSENVEAKKKISSTFIRCTEAKLDAAKYALEQARAEKMNIVMMKTGHNPMVTAPKMLVDELNKAAGVMRKV